MSSNAPEIPVAMQIGKPGDQFITCLIQAGTTDMQILTDGFKGNTEYCMMLLAALNAILLAIHKECAKEKSLVIDPFAGLRRKG